MPSRRRWTRGGSATPRGASRASTTSRSAPAASSRLPAAAPWRLGDTGRTRAARIPLLTRLPAVAARPRTPSLSRPRPARGDPAGPSAAGPLSSAGRYPAARRAAATGASGHRRRLAAETSACDEGGTDGPLALGCIFRLQGRGTDGPLAGRQDRASCVMKDTELEFEFSRQDRARGPPRCGRTWAG